FNSSHLISRRDYDPAFLVHLRGYDSNTQATKERRAREIVKTVMIGHCNVSWLACPSRLSWHELLHGKATKKRVQVGDLTAFGDRGLMRVSRRLYVCHPLRNLYIPSQSVRARLVVDFCAEMMRLFRELRSEYALITISSSKRNMVLIKANIDAQMASAQGSKNSEVDVSIEQSWPSPVRPEEERFGVDDKVWFFLDETGGVGGKELYGLDFASAVETVLNMKRDRVASKAAIKSNRVQVVSKISAELMVLAKVEQLGGAEEKESLEEDPTFEIKYEARVFEWDGVKKRWG
ncbi:MAG: hypothetical protein AAF607_16150, partial [Pseudomonadota bacterium]